MSIRIQAVSTKNPEFSRSTPQILPMLEAWMLGKESREIAKARKIFEGAGVDRRYSIMEPEQVFTATSFEQKNDLYIKAATDLSEAVLADALQQAGWQARDLDYIITVSCTGFMIPSVDAALINRLNLRQDIVRLPVTEMGCAGGVSGLIYAAGFLRDNPGKKAAVICAEAPTATFQLDDYSMANIVSAALFGDGAACVLLSSDATANGPEIVDFGMYHFYDSEHMMGFSLTNSGLKMVLDVDVPVTIESHFPDIIDPILLRNGVSKKDLALIFHPGGRKIVAAAENFFQDPKALVHTRKVLRDYGNMSSATVLFVLREFIESQPAKDTNGLMLSFGPGFSAQRILLRW